MDNQLIVADILIWEATNALLLIPVVIGLVMLVRWIRGRPVFTDRDRRFLFGQRREGDFTPKLWLRFIAWRFAVTLVGFAILLSLIAAILLLAPKWLR